MKDTQAPTEKTPATKEPKAPENGSRLLRWAAGSALIGLLLIYNSVDASSSSPSEPAAAGAPTVAAGAPPGTPPGSPANDPAGPSADAQGPGGPAMPSSAPKRLTIPRIGVNAPFSELGLDENGTLEAPSPDDNNLVGWYADGVTPGERGNAIVAGHVDTKTGPAVFWRLGTVTPGTTVNITREDGSTAVFTVDAVETFAKDDFPDERVYGHTDDAQLRLITCGGNYDKKAKDYTANVVVFAHLQSYRAP
ncbi:class F sortase [Streptomyces sp. SCUT-3]|uniref:class F sortase n=1 Tax=Streptomyces sp. SCUT-3 TaxID=2684469 RepID=UPI002174D3A9|nr:class F sortase [Streptomyces sp. SCUT-3]